MVREAVRKPRGMIYLLVQGVLFLLILLGPRSATGTTSHGPYGALPAGVMLVGGALLALAGVINLGKNLTPLPVPKQHATLVVGGAYRIVRHPIYSGIILMAFGWGAWLQSWLTGGYALLLLIFFDIKSRYEERLLREKFPDYGAYQLKVRKLIPFVY